MDFVGNYHAIPCRHNRVMKTIEYISLRHYGSSFSHKVFWHRSEGFFFFNSYLLEKCPEKDRAG